MATMRADMRLAYRNAKFSAASCATAGVLFSCLFASVCASAQKAPQPPKPADEGPNLEVTMKFIQDKLTEQGTIHYALYTHDNLSGADTGTQVSFEVSSFTFDGCKYDFRSKWDISKNGDAPSGMHEDGSIEHFKSAEVRTAESWWNQELADEGSPSRTARAEPDVFVLSLVEGGWKKKECKENGQEVACPKPNLWSRMGHTWSFRDEDTANRVAKALVHAVELCGGGSKPEPF